MSGRSLRILSLLIVAAGLIARCDDAPEPPAPVQQQPWERKPAGLDEYLASTRAAESQAATRAAAAATREAARPATRTGRVSASSRPIDALSRPGETVNYMFEQMRKDNFTEIRDLMYEPTTSSALRGIFANAVRGLARGTTVTILDEKEFGSSAIVIYQSRGPVPAEDDDLSWILLHRRFDRWKILIDPPNPKRLAPDERKNFMDTMEWGTKRMQEITAASTQPTTPSAKPPTAATTAPWAAPTPVTPSVPIQ